MQAKRHIQLLSLLFGAGSWIAITGLWLELPLLILNLPEKWALGSYLNIMIQIANIGPIIYWIFKKLKICNEVSATHIQMFIGIFSCLLLIFAWDKTFYLFGENRSVMLFIASFGLAIVDCTSSVTFLPFMARFDRIYLTPYLIGEGLSGFIPLVVASLQGVGEENECNSSNSTINAANVARDPRFSAETFFASLLATLLISWVAFLLLQILPVARQEQLNHSNKLKTLENLNKEQEVEKSSIQSSKSGFTENPLNLKSKTYIYLLCLMCWLCTSTFGFMPPLQSYSSLPYGNEILHYVVIASGLAYPTGCFIGMFVETRSLKAINILSIIGTMIGVYIVFSALNTHNPPLSATFMGGTLMIMAWTTFTAILSYAKTIITLIINDSRGDEGLFWVGMSTQFGAAFGAAFIFTLINYTNLFQESSCK